MISVVFPAMQFHPEEYPRSTVKSEAHISHQPNDAHSYQFMDGSAKHNPGKNHLGSRVVKGPRNHSFRQIVDKPTMLGDYYVVYPGIEEDLLTLPERGRPAS